jgi:hypothetical protein
MASQLKKERIAMTNRLENIAVRQRSSRVRDYAFAALLLLAGAVSLSSISLGAHAASSGEVAKR